VGVSPTDPNHQGAGQGNLSGFFVGMGEAWFRNENEGGANRLPHQAICVNDDALP
jgi:hypothetical protein